MSMDANGLSLTKFCEKYNLPYMRIWYRMSVKNMNLAEAIKDYRQSENKPHNCKYYFKGMTARQYCKKNNLNYDAIIMYCSRKGIDVKDYLNERL